MPFPRSGPSSAHLNPKPKWPFWVAPVKGTPPVIPTVSVAPAIPPDVPRRRQLQPFLRIRGHRFEPLFTQDAPPLVGRTATRARACIAQPRGHRSFPTQPQLNPPYPWPNRASSLERKLFGVEPRGKQSFPVQPQIPVPPTVPGNRSPAGRRWDSPARGRRWLPVPAQIAVPAPVWPNRVSSLARRLFALEPRGKRPFPTQPQIPVPPTIPGNRQPAGRRWVFLVRGRRSWPTAPQDPAWPTRIDQARSKLSMLRRGRQTITLPVQVTAPKSALPNRAPSKRPFWALIRGRQRTPVPVQATVPAPPFLPGRPPIKPRAITPARGRRTQLHYYGLPPTICLPTIAVITGYQSTAAIVRYLSGAGFSAYSSAATITGYQSTAAITTYTSSGAISHYTSAGTLVTYTSGATFKTCGI